MVAQKLAGTWCPERHTGFSPGDSPPVQGDYSPTIKPGQCIYHSRFPFGIYFHLYNFIDAVIHGGQLI